MSRIIGEWVEGIFVLDVEAGSEIAATIKAAIALSCSNGATVMFDFNDKTIMVDKHSSVKETYEAYFDGEREYKG